VIALIESECNTSIPIHTSIREKITQPIGSTSYTDINNSAMFVGLDELSENVRNTTAVCFKLLEVFNHSSIETTEPQHVTLTAWIRIILEILIVAGYQKRPRPCSYKNRRFIPTFKTARYSPCHGSGRNVHTFISTLTFILKLSLHLRLDFPSDLFRLVFPTEAVYEFLIFCMCARWQPCDWRFKSFGRWRWLVGRIVPEVYKAQTVFAFWAKQYKD
jgi:hypothetical protein